jgi:hypothetical protein
MSKKTRFYILALVLVIFLCYQGTLSLLRWFLSEETRYDGREWYTIHSDTILQDLLTGNPGVFILKEDDSYTSIGEPVEWNVEDYEFIAEVFHELTSGESLDNWQLSGVMFSWDCEHFDKGPQEALLRYIKIEKIRETESRFLSHVFIEPRRNELSGGIIEFYPRVLRWEVADPAKTIGVEEALHIAESNGGSEFRGAVDNHCEITASYYPKDFLDLGYDGWVVDYDNSSPGMEDTYYINPKTGEVEDIQ